MKKIIAMLLPLIMICSLATTAFADECNCPEATVAYNCPVHGCVDGSEADCKNGECEFHHPADQDENATINKYFDILGGEAPIETFDFTLDFVKYVSHEGEIKTEKPANAPTVTIGDAVYSTVVEKDTEAPVSVEITNVTNAPLGVYSYKISEVAANTAGVNYNTEKIYLNVTVLRDEQNSKHYVAAIHYETEDGEKVGYIKNEYEAGQLTISKTITGNMAEMSETFPFEVTFTPENSAYLTNGEDPVVTVFKDNQVVSQNEVTRTVNADGTITVTFALGHTDNVVITNIPDGTTYTVKETDLKGYEQTSANGEAVGEAVNGSKPVSGTIENGDTDTATFNNDRTEGVDTGIALDSAPYFLMLAVAVVGMVALISKKRYEV